MKLKTTVTNIALLKNNQFKIADFENYTEVVVQTSYKKESVRMSFPRRHDKYPMNHPDVVAAIKKATDTTVDSLKKHLAERGVHIDAEGREISETEARINDDER